jgi:hypothetical protein
MKKSAGATCGGHVVGLGGGGGGGSRRHSDGDVADGSTERDTADALATTSGLASGAGWGHELRSGVHKRSGLDGGRRGSLAK